MKSNSIKYIWASKDRYTASTTVYEKTHPSGMVERVTVEETRVLYPKLHQIMQGKYQPTVISKQRTLISGRTGKTIKPRTKYWTASQSGFGGRGTERDSLGGFWTGQFETYYQKAKVTASVNDLLNAGFVKG